MNPFNITKSVIKVELFLSITLCLLPILLPIFAGELLGSISHYAYSKAWWLYVTLLTFISVSLVFDGIRDKHRRFNIALGILMLGVLIFPVEQHRYVHDVFAVLFFLENLSIITYFSKILSKHVKIIIAMVVIFTLSLYFFDVINLFVAEAIGLILLSFFFFIRFLRIY